MHSRVREDARIAFTGAAYDQSFVLADVHMDWPLARDEVSLFFSPEGSVVVAPLPENRHRIVVLAGADTMRLDAWADARHRVAADVVAFTDRMTRMATLGSPTARSLRNAAISMAGHLPFVTQALTRKIAELEPQDGSIREGAGSRMSGFRPEQR
jgi:2-polyprenyl-6-methoxyphenol hydroxylase-like FAD-dependent oxidoreductase